MEANRRCSGVEVFIFNQIKWPAVHRIGIICAEGLDVEMICTPANLLIRRKANLDGPMRRTALDQLGNCCNNLRNAGFVIAAKQPEALRILNQKVRDRELDKRYLAVIQGIMSPPQGRLTGQIFKDAAKNRVYVTDKPQPGSKTAVTFYRTLRTGGGLSLVECQLITGRTHQIRAQFAHAGHPLVGDGKYGKLSKQDNRRYQALYAYRLSFRFTTDAGCLAYLNGKSFQVAQVPFVETYFPSGERR